MNNELDNLQNADGNELNHQTEENNNLAENDNLEVPTAEGNDFKSEDSEATEDNDAQIEISVTDYSTLSLEEILADAKNLLVKYPINQLRNHFNAIREAVKKVFDQEEKTAKTNFVEEGGNEVDFTYSHPLKRDFYQIYNEFKHNLDAYYKEQEKLEKLNLTEREDIIEKLKALYQEPNENNTNLFKTFRDLKTRWHNAGTIPKANANNVFRTYYFHLDNFYKYLDMNKELQSMDYAHNLEVRESIINRAEELIQEPNVQKALNELQYLHRLWKEEAVPVAEELREPTWQKFKDITNKIHERKAELGEKIKAEQQENYAKKQAIISEIQRISHDVENKSHAEWQKRIKNINQLREQFFVIGKVSKEYNQAIWNEFSEVCRDFNIKKNSFYKNLKNTQQDNLNKKMQLLTIALENKDSTDWNQALQIFKKIQNEWKTIGHVPRKNSDKIWKDFKDACNAFFDNYKGRNNKANEQLEHNYEAKKALLEHVKTVVLPSETHEVLTLMNEYNNKWNNLGKVPSGKADINQEFQKLLKSWTKDLKISETELQDYNLKTLVDQIKANGDSRLLDDEIRKTKKQIEELEKEIVQLDNNVNFFSNAEKDNPLLRDVYRQIEEKRKSVKEEEIKLRKLFSIDLSDTEE